MRPLFTLKRSILLGYLISHGIFPQDVATSGYGLSEAMIHLAVDHFRIRFINPLFDLLYRVYVVLIVLGYVPNEFGEFVQTDS